MRAHPVLLLSVALAACEPPREAVPSDRDEAARSTPVTNSSNSTTLPTIPEDVSYTIISDEALPPYKRSLDIRLNQKVSEEVLAAIAHDLRSRDTRQFERTFIVHYLPGMEVGSGGWATTHFDPTLKVTIQGLTREEETALASERSSAGGDVVGQWLDDRPYAGHRITIYRSTGQLMLERKFRDGSSSEERLREVGTSSRRRFEEVGNQHGEYFVIDARGDLQIWDPEGLITTARTID